MYFLIKLKRLLRISCRSLLNKFWPGVKFFRTSIFNSSESWFSFGILFFSGIGFKKKEKLTDIGFLLVFPGLEERYFSMDLDWFRLMFVEHQSTSEYKDRVL